MTLKELQIKAFWQSSGLMLAILAAIAVPNFVGMNEKAANAAAQANLKGSYKEFIGHFNTNSEYFNFKEHTIQIPVKSMKVKSLNKIEYLVSPAIDYRYRNQMLPVRDHIKQSFTEHPEFYNRNKCIEKCTIDPSCDYIIIKNNRL